MEYTVMVHKAEEGGYWVEGPTLPGCFSQGGSVEEALENVREAVEAHLQALREDGREIPEEKDILLGKVQIAAAGD